MHQLRYPKQKLSQLAIVSFFIFHYLCFTGICHSQKTDKLSIKLDKPSEILGQRIESYNVVQMALKVINAVKKDTSLSQLEKSTLKKSESALLKVFLEKIPSRKDVRIFNQRHAEKRTAFITKYGDFEGNQQFAQLMRKEFEKQGMLVNVRQQWDAVVEIIDSMKSDFSRYQELKSVFNLAFAICKKNPIALITDPVVAREIQLSENDLKKVIASSKKLSQDLNKKILKEKQLAFSQIWNVLDERQQQKFLRLYGKTERVFKLENANRTTKSLVQEWEGIAWNKTVFYPVDRVDELISHKVTQKLTKNFASKKISVSGQEISELEKLISDAANSRRPKFPNRQAFEFWLDQRKSKILNLQNYVKRHSAQFESPERMGEKLSELLKSMSEFREGKTTLSDMRTNKPMIYYLVEHDKLNDNFDKNNFRPTERQKYCDSNLFPFFLTNPYPKTLFPNKKVSPEDYFHQQSITLEKLNEKWAKELALEKGYSGRIEINNRYLVETRKHLLPHQLGILFEKFFDNAGLIGMFEFHDVMVDFGMSEMQRNSLRDTSKKMASRLKRKDRELKGNAIEKLFSVLPPKSSRLLFKSLGTTKNELVNYYVKNIGDKKLVDYLDLKESPYNHFEAMRYWDDPNRTKSSRKSYFEYKQN